MKKIFTLRNASTQRTYMWASRLIDDEVAACPRRLLSEVLAEHLPRTSPVIEAGCGLGAWVIYLSRLGYDIEGIDHNPDVIARVSNHTKSARVRLSDIRHLPYPDKYAGAMISLGVVEHFEDGCADALREANRVLKEGGLLFLTVPLNNVFRRLVTNPLRSIYLMALRAAGRNVSFMEYHYSRDEVLALLRSHGFEPELVTWDDFTNRRESLGLWADFPPLRGREHQTLTRAGQALATVLKRISPWLSTSGILCVARKISQDTPRAVPLDHESEGSAAPLLQRHS
jgi:SAM-dependent methyltransferase